jgi:cell division protein FtsI (penicillin-binding protein 3)
VSGDRTARRQALRRQALLAAWLLASAGLLGRAVQVQMFESDVWRAQAEDQQREANAIPAPRGTIFDRNGVPLAMSREQYRIELDSDQLPDRDSVRTILTDVLGLSDREARNRTDPERDWAVVPGRYEPSVRTLLQGLPGVYLYRELQRDYPYRALSAGVLGTVIDGAGAGGIEGAFEDVLAGRPGSSIVAKDVQQRPIPGQVFEVRPPVAGGDVHLTLDLSTQENGQFALQEAIDDTGARGGDLIVADPHTGEILAMVSIHEGSSNSLSAINRPVEPGSTMKPFTVAALLQTRKASLSDMVEVGNGTWRINGRTLSDVHVDSSTISVAGALRESSNVGIAKAALPLTHSEQYQNLRDFGFGIPTGLGLPAESGGLLRHPRDWRPMSAQSLAVGYEISATPLQLAMAYGALANGGELMEARLVSSTRTREGRARRYAPQVVRRVVDAAVTREIGRVLTDAVREGTATRASLASFDVAGKTGTARVYNPEIGGYEDGRYFSSFVGYFPAEAPQLVILVMLDSPTEGGYYGGAVAAPVTRATVEAALAARTSPLDRSRLLDLAGEDVATSQREAPPVRFASTSPVGPARSAFDSEPVRGIDPVPAGTTDLTMPDVSGLPLRDAVRRLHALGFRVQIEPGGKLVVTDPPPGGRSVVGDTIRVRTGPPPARAVDAGSGRPDR